MARANYRIIRNDSKIILLEDIGPWDVFQSITNAAETVLEELKPALTGGVRAKRLLYLDSEKELTEIVYNNGKFVRFNQPSTIL